MFYFRNIIRISTQLRYIIIPSLLFLYYVSISILVPTILENNYYNQILINHTYDQVVFYNDAQNEDTYLSLNGTANLIIDEFFVNTGLYMMIEDMNYVNSPFKNYDLSLNEIIIPEHVANVYDIVLNQEIEIKFGSSRASYVVKYIVPTTFDFDEISKRDGLAVIPYNQEIFDISGNKYIHFSRDESVFFEAISDVIFIDNIISTSQDSINQNLIIFGIFYVIIFIIVEFVLGEQRTFEYKSRYLIGLNKRKLFLWIYIDLFLRYQLFYLTAVVFFVMIESSLFYNQIPLYFLSNIVFSTSILIIIDYIYLRRVTK